MRIPLPALAFALLASAPAAAQAGVRVEGRAPAAEGASGTLATAVFRVTSTRTAPVQVLPRVGLPAGWRLLTPEAEWSLAPGAAETRILSIVVPASTAAGAYTVSYAAGTGGRDSVLVRVAARRRVDVSAGDAPRFAMAGAGYAAAFVVRNAGNAPQRVQLAARGDHGLAASADPAVVDLAPGEARTVRALVPSGGARDAHFTHAVTLVATAADDATVAGRAASRVEIVPAPGRTGARFHTVPAEVRLRGTGADGAMAVTAALSAAGPVA
ncbi:MAG TPA: NEW3 domain-containing protein, partial [Longimicrobiaceae bacterium]|nr:NEW3 domain-containing protein [Longimicrobiaceae bacterium]